MQSTPTACANPLATFFWKGDTPPTVGDVSWQCWEYEESIPSSIIAAAEKLTGKLTHEFQQFRENVSYSLPVQACISTIDSRCLFAQRRGYRRYTPWGTPWLYLWNHGEHMREWDGQPTLILDAQVQDLQGKPAKNRFLFRKVAAQVSSGQFSRKKGSF